MECCPKCIPEAGEAVTFGDSRAGGSPKLLAPLLFIKQTNDGAREIRGIIRQYDLTSIIEIEAFSSYRGGHDGFTHCGSFKDFQPRAAADA